MKITIDIADERINNVLEAPRSRYWASFASWDPLTMTGEVQERGGRLHQISRRDLELALQTMADSYPEQFAALTSGDYDGTTGDVLLQLMAFGILKYGGA